MNRTRTQTNIDCFVPIHFLRFPTPSYAPISLHLTLKPYLILISCPVNRSYTKEDDSPGRNKTGGRLELGSTGSLEVTSLSLLVVDHVPGGGEVLRDGWINERLAQQPMIQKHTSDRVE